MNREQIKKEAMEKFEEKYENLFDKSADGYNYDAHNSVKLFLANSLDLAMDATLEAVLKQMKAFNEEKRQEASRAKHTSDADVAYTKGMSDALFAVASFCAQFGTTKGSGDSDPQPK